MRNQFARDILVAVVAALIVDRLVVAMRKASAAQTPSQPQGVLV